MRLVGREQQCLSFLSGLKMGEETAKVEEKMKKKKRETDHV